jgi:S1-C subfamily serine protease
MGWRFDEKNDPAFPDRPWVVGTLWPGGAAERAGVQAGDRVIEVGGKPATSDVGPLWALEQQAVGTKVPVVLARAGASKDRVRLSIELRSPTP